MKVAVFQIGSLGDTLVSIPAYRAVRRHFGSAAKITVVHNLPSDNRVAVHDVLAHTGLVDSFIGYRHVTGKASWRTVLALWPKLARGQFDCAVYLGPAQKSASEIKRDRLFFRACGVRRLYGFTPCDPKVFAARAADGRPVPVPHEAVQRCMRLLAHGWELSADDDFAVPMLRIDSAASDKAGRWIREHRTRPDMPIVAICPGANFSSKIWPVDRFAEVGKRIIGQIHMEPLVIGGPLEAALGDQLVETWGCGANAAGKFTVMESAALMSHARFLLGLDTGTTHLAASLGIPCVALFSEHNHPGQWEPLGGGHIVIREKVPCVACRMRICPIPEHPCMSNISVDRVWNSVVEMAKRRGAGSVATESTLVGM